MHMDNHIDLAA